MKNNVCLVLSTLMCVVATIDNDRMGWVMNNKGSHAGPHEGDLVSRSDHGCHCDHRAFHEHGSNLSEDEIEDLVGVMGQHHNDGLYFVVPHVRQRDANIACHRHGGELVNVNIENFSEVTLTAFRFSGPYSDSWIGSWNGDDYRKNCLVLSTGAAAPGGSINVLKDCDRPRNALCQRRLYCKGKHGKGCCHQWHRKHEHHKHCRDRDSCGCGCNCNCQNVFFRYSGNRLPSIGPNGTFTYLSLGNYTSNDGKLSIAGNKLIVDSYPYTSLQTDLFDHIKFLIYTNQQFAVPKTGELSFTAVLGGACFNVSSQPFGSLVQDVESDPRLASLALNILDFSNDFVFDFLITNTKIYIIYERLTLSRPVLGNYAAYTFAIPVADNKPGQLHRCSINFNADERSVRWILDGKEVYKVYDIGSLLSRQYMILDEGGVQEIKFPTSLQVGFGTFTALDGYSLCNVKVPAPDGGLICKFPANDEGLVQLSPNGTQFNPRNGVQNATFFFSNAPNPAYQIWGQGCILTVEELTVGYCKQPRIL